MPWEAYEYAVYAELRDWTPDQVDALPLRTEPWLIPIWDAIAEARAAEQQRRDKEASDAASRKQRKGITT